MKKSIRYKLAGSAAFVACVAILASCDGDSGAPSATKKAIGELQIKYDELVADRFESPVQWAADDLENIGDWEYKILDLPDADPESLQVTLNDLGNERWEVFWMENNRGDYRIMLKRPSRSYLSRIPLSQIGRFVIGGSGTDE